MDRWFGKVAVVTGASSGIGLAIARSLLENGMIVVGLARRSELMQERMSDIKSLGKFYAKKCDISDEEQVKLIFAWIRDTLKNVHVLINNAGMSKMKSLLDMPTEDMEQVVNLNLMGSIYCIREAAKLLKQNDEEAIILNINSVAGHYSPRSIDLNVYPATKYALKAVTEICRKEFIKNKNIRVASVSPGLVKTEIIDSTWVPLPKYANEPILAPEDVANSVLHIISAPSHVNITEMIVLPTGSSFP